MAAGIASGFVRKLYRILDQESDAIVGWDASGLSFSIHDSKQLNDSVLPRYFRGRMSAFRQQLLDHGFEQVECEDDEARECYAHPHFLRGCPDRLSYIVRNPKPKLKAGQAPPQTQPPKQPQQQRQAYTSHQQPHQHAQQPSLGIHIAPTTKGPGRASLTVTLSTGKRAIPMNGSSLDFAHKRFRGALEQAEGSGAQRPSGPVPAPPPPANLSRNPLFSNDTSSELGLDVARVFSLSRISDSGLLPNSTDLPEPISYLNKILNATSSSTSAPPGAASSSSSVASSAPASMEAPVFSEDLMKSALYFLVSTSTTGVGPDQQTAEEVSSGTGKPDVNSWAARMERVSTSGFLSSLLVSSATGKDNQSGAGAPLSSGSVWGTTNANPLFSRSTEQDEEEEDSIWNLLLASSIDRVKSAIQEVVSPQERLRLILEERERLEEQRKRIYGMDNDDNTASTTTDNDPHKPTTTQSAKPLKSALKKPAANPLFSGGKPATTKGLLFTQSGSTPTPHGKNALFSKPSVSVSSSNPLFANDDADVGDEVEQSAKSQNTPFSSKDDAEASASSLFSRADSSTTSSSAPAATVARPVLGGASNAEDGLWRLLMTSSVDWLRKGAAEFEV